MVLATNVRTARAIASRREDLMSTDAGKFYSFWFQLDTSKTERVKQLIKTTDGEWRKVEKGAKILKEFCDTYELPMQQGVRLLYDCAQEIMGARLSITKLHFYKAKLFELFEAKIVIVDDPTQEETQALIKAYKKLVLDEVNVSPKMFSKVSIYVNFVYAKLQADSFGATYSNWIKAQVEGLEGLNIFPEPKHLYGTGAESRWLTFCMKPSNKRRRTARPLTDARIQEILNKKREANSQ